MLKSYPVSINSVIRNSKKDDKTKTLHEQNKCLLLNSQIIISNQSWLYARIFSVPEKRKNPSTQPMYIYEVKLVSLPPKSIFLTDAKLAERFISCKHHQQQQQNNNNLCTNTSIFGIQPYYQIFGWFYLGVPQLFQVFLYSCVSLCLYPSDINCIAYLDGNYRTPFCFYFN